MLKSSKIPFAYREWPEELGPPSLPWGVYLQVRDHPFGADGIVYANATGYHVELYTERKEPETEAKLETAFSRAGIYYQKSELYIDSERLYEILYEIEV